MSYKKKNTQKTVPSIKHAIILTVLLLSLFLLSMSTLAKDTKNLMLEDININETVMLDKNIIKELINDNIETLNMSSRIDRSTVEYIAFKQFLYYRQHGEVSGCKFGQTQNAYLDFGDIYFKVKTQYNTKQFSVPIYVDDNGNFSVSLTGSGEKSYKGGPCPVWYGTIKGNRRTDGNYNISVKRNAGAYGVEPGKGLGSHVSDSQGNVINQKQIRRRSQAYLQKELGKIQYLEDVNKNMLSAILAGNDVYDIDYLEKGSNHTIYADKVDGNIEIRFVKADDGTFYGVYVLSLTSANSNCKSGKCNRQAQETNNGSEIYAFKYSDDSTSKKKRITLMTKRVVQYDFNEEYPSTQKYTTGTKVNESSLSQEFITKTGLFTRRISGLTSEKLNTIYENFMAEGIIYSTYTKDENGKFYKNQQVMF